MERSWQASSFFLCIKNPVVQSADSQWVALCKFSGFFLGGKIVEWQKLCYNKVV